MARSKITSASKDLITDNGAVLVSVIQGEQIHLELTFNWLTNLTGYDIDVVVQEGLNDGNGSVPKLIQPDGETTELVYLNPEPTDNKITVVIPKDLGENWVVQPKPDAAVYGFIEVSIKDPGEADQQQIWKPFRGMVELKYSPTKGY
jgi:hypothetical protein